MFQLVQKKIESNIQAFCTEKGISLAELKWSYIPFSGEWGMSTSFFQTAADEARSGIRSGLPVPQRAQQIAEQVRVALGHLDGISHIEVVKGYLNLYFSTPEFARLVVDTVLKQGSDFGRGAAKGERVMVEYAQPNTHHSFHIGHYRNTILGEVLSRLVEFAGFETIRASYPGDIGLSVITVIWTYKRFYYGQEPQGVHERGQWLGKLYTEAISLLEPKESESEEEKQQRQAYEAERRDIYRLWDAGDPEIRQLWLKTREWSLEELRDILKMLDVRMDVWFFESDVDEPSKLIVDELIQKGIADDERAQGGAVIVKIDEKLGLTKEKYRTNVLLRSDGTTLYLTKDLALAKLKFEKYHVDRSIYVVDVRQSLHLQQTFAILKLWGFTQAEKCFHLGYGFVSLPEGAMSSRRGRVVLFKDVYDEAERRALAAMGERTPDMAEEQRTLIARHIGLGALAYAMLSVDNNKDIVFDIDEALNFDGRTGPYIQNAYVRANSILKKAGGMPASASYEYELNNHEVQLIEMISRFPAIVQQAAEEYRPLVMATYAYDLANTFHSFYHAVQVLQSDTEEIKVARLRLVAAARQTISNALLLLGITAPEAM
ncbi:MAG: arginine--tRNA ligase [Chloroflexi bacterium GWD2_49_16]|nr:MAG: arginine--tRNA ligase [Chloroflexi bacterium GWC2_49_37]OGN83527.1 MAG: arginine--tRNA ligase [Chloroflexi bacterium GWD2_49_16]HBG73932.1 arginine--tRNA ligase [Anaerolineae bacterium]